MSEKYDMMCGIEIHQQLDTHKLFCDCESNLSEEGNGGVSGPPPPRWERSTVPLWHSS